MMVKLVRKLVRNGHLLTALAIVGELLRAPR